MDSTDPRLNGYRANSARNTGLPRYDFTQIDAVLLRNSLGFLRELLPDGKLEGREYSAINPTRDDHSLGSFKINTVTAEWSDFATGDKGRGLLELYAYLRHGRNLKAAADLAPRYGIQPQAGGNTKAKPKDDRENWEPITPVPDDAPPPPTYTTKPKETVTQYDYRGTDGRLLHSVYRIDWRDTDGKSHKKFAPVTWCKHKETGAHGWQWKAIPDHRPLYGLEILADKVGAPVCICEGEKAVHAARELLPGWVCVTSSSGGKAGHLADWMPLAGRRVMIWRDADEEGTQYAQTVTAALHDAGVSSVQWLALEIFGDNLKKGFDAADAVAAGWTPERLAKALQSDTATETPTAPDDDPDEGKPIIRLIPGNRHKVLIKVERILLAAGVLIFDRGGQLVRPIIQLTDVPIDGAKIPAGSLAIKEVTAGWLTRIFDQHATWLKLIKGDLVRVDCPAGHADLYLQSVGEWCVPTLTGITEAPTLRADGTLLVESGYDSRSGLYLDYTGKPVIVPESPTRDDAAKALEALKAIIAEFPFVDDTSRSVALSGMLTAVARRALRTAPFHCYDSPEKGTGKSLLANVSAIIATGRQATTATLTTSPDENQKRLEAYLIRGVSFLNIDNVSHPVEGDFFCSLATEETVDPRVLGHSTFVKVKTNTVVITITGNNMTLAGDVTRRALLCRIDAQMERPDARTFTIGDLKRHVADHRHELLAAVLTVLRAYIVAGYPPNYVKDDEGNPVTDANGNPKLVAPYGSFYDWDKLIRGTLLWLGEADPLASRSRILEVDPESLNLGALLTAWHALFGQVAMTAKEVIAQVSQQDTARDWRAGRDDDTEESAEYKQRRGALFDVLLDIALTKDGKGIDARSLGHYLSKNADKVNGDLRLERAGEQKRATRWRVRKLEPKGDKPKGTRTETPGNGEDKPRNFGEDREITHLNSPNSPEKVSYTSYDELFSAAGGKLNGDNPPDYTGDPGYLASLEEEARHVH